MARTCQLLQCLKSSVLLANTSPRVEVRCRRAKWGGRHGAPEKETSRWGNLLNDRNGLVTAFNGTVDDLLRRLAHGGSIRTPSAYE